MAATTLAETSWHGSSPLRGDVVTAVRRLKERPGRELQVHGSATLARTLVGHDLVDRYRFYVCPVHLGEGRRLLGDGLPAAALELVGCRTTSTGVVVADYRPAGGARHLPGHR